MNKLIPFDTIYLQKLEIFSDLMIPPEDPSLLILSFHISDEANEVNFPETSIQLAEDGLEKKDELWKSTCFEMFLNPVGQKQYFEFNFSPFGFWNCYHFAGYRFPQPPEACRDFEILHFSFQKNQLELRLKNKTAFKQFHVGLTAVIKNKKDQVTYLALKHENSKPDFHLAGTFTLQRGSDGI